RSGKQLKDSIKFVSADFIPIKPIEKIAGIVGPDMGTSEGVDHGKLQTHTLWGEIAFQIGGAAGYELMRSNDEQRTAPGTQVWEKLIGDEPALIMIDEIAYYLRVARGTK